MGACCIQYVLLLSLLGFFPCSDTLTCQEGSMIRMGNDLMKKAVLWREKKTMITMGEEMCQEVFLLINVGEKSVIIGSKGASTVRHRNVRNITVFSRGPGIMIINFYHVCDFDLCNTVNSSRVLLDSLPRVAPPVPGNAQCRVCLNFKGACNHKSKLVFCPRGTRCYNTELVLQGGGISAVISISGCLFYPQKLLFKNQSSIGTISIKETRLPSKTINLFSHVLVPGTLPAWMLGLRALLSPLCAGICPLC
ncbi:CD177 antigen-like [Arvicanthis niloticus]|uniref:CD177 antigen-like n=1 Tax=Arvicanthis niloticus TaxID=61156 RepID=UPI001486E21D|nr:CD177 antigen-like [Arvicanthis niloticus]